MFAVQGEEKMLDNFCIIPLLGPFHTLSVHLPSRLQTGKSCDLCALGLRKILQIAEDLN